MTDAALRVAIVAPYDLSADGGINNQIRAQARALRRLGHVVTVAGPASGEVEPAEEPLGRTIRVTFGGTESGLGLDPRAVGATERLLRRPFDIVHVHEPMVPLVPWLTVLRARAPVVATFHVHREQGHRLYRTWSWALQRLARRLGARIAVSEAAHRTAASHFPGHYDIVPNGIEAGRFSTPQPAPPALGAGRRHVLYVGRLEPRKGIEHLVRAMARVAKTIASAQLTIVGAGRARDALERLARQISAPVQFAGRVPDASLPSYLQASDLLCAPAIGGESFGVVLLEAMAAGTAVIASRIEGYEALTGPTGAALLVPPANDEGLAEAIAYVLGSPERRQALVVRGAALAREHDWRTLAPRLVAIYRRAIRDAQR